jgi:uncharacterized membrane protein
VQDTTFSSHCENRSVSCLGEGVVNSKSSAISSTISCAFQHTMQITNHDHKEARSQNTLYIVMHSFVLFNICFLSFSFSFSFCLYFNNDSRKINTLFYFLFVSINSNRIISIDRQIEKRED